MKMRRQGRGSSLLLCLLLLLPLTLLVSLTWADSRWELRLAARDLAEQRALTAARSALAWAEAWLMSLPGEARPPPCPAPCTIQPASHGQPPGGQSERWWLEHAHADGWQPESESLLMVRQPRGTPVGRWWIGELWVEPGAPGAQLTYYRVLARAARAPAGEPIVLESIVARPWGHRDWQDPLPAVQARFCQAVATPQPCGRTAWQRQQ